MPSYNVGVGRELYSTLCSSQTRLLHTELGEGCSKHLLSRLSIGCNKTVHLLAGLQAEQAGLSPPQPISYQMFLVQPQGCWSVSSRVNPTQCLCPPLSFILDVMSHLVSAFVRPMSCEELPLLPLVVRLLLQPSCGEETTWTEGGHQERVCRRAQQKGR